MNYEEYVNSIISNNLSSRHIDLKEGCISLEKLLNDNPALVAAEGFIDGIVETITERAVELHGKGQYHLCYSPQCIFVKSTNRIDPSSAMLLSPELLTDDPLGIAICNPDVLYRGMEEYIAPEVMAGGTIDERSDIYSIGQFISWIYTTAERPLGYGRIIRKATAEDPDDRYDSISALTTAMARAQKLGSSVRMCGIAAVIAVLIVGAFFAFAPEPQQMEYVKPSPKESLDALLDGSITGEEIGIDSTMVLTAEQEEQLRAFEAKSEEIFRKRFEKDADKILSKVYSSTYMSGAEKNFIAGSMTMSEELITAQREAAEASGVSEIRSTAIATEIIERLTAEKTQKLKNYGFQK